MPSETAGSDPGKQRRIAGMFDRIAPTYDRLNHLLSFGTDKRWRRKLSKSLDGSERVLDLAAGTGDQMLDILKQVDSIRFAVGADLSKEMLTVALGKLTGGPERLVQANATYLPFQSDSFDAVTISFGIRNVVEYEAGLKEMNRILNPGGRAVILEFGLPSFSLMRYGYLFYFRHILPTIGGWISGDKNAYTYLNETVERFPYGQTFADKMTTAGFKNVRYNSLSGGIAYLYFGEK